MEDNTFETTTSQILSTVDRPEIDDILSELQTDQSWLHVFGEVGTMRDDVLNRVISDLSDTTICSFHVTDIYDKDYLTQQIAKELFEILPRHQQIRLKLKSANISTPIGGAGAGVENPFDRPIDLLQQIADRTGSETVVFVHDVHSLSGEQAAIQAQLQTIADALPPNISLVTSGEYILETTSIEIGPLPEEVFVHHLTRELEAATLDQATEIYDAVDGMPLYLGLIIESHSAGEELNTDRITEEIAQLVEDYVTTLSVADQEFLRKSSVLLELDEHICSELLDISAVEAANTLQNLHEKLAIQKVGRREGISRYKIRDDIRHYLYRHTADAQSAHQRMFRYYVDELRSDNSDSFLGRALYPGLPCSYHLKGSISDGASAPQVKKQLDALDLSLDDKVEFCFTFLPIFCFREDGMETVLFDVLDEIRDETEQGDLDETQLMQLIGIDGYRVGYRILFAQMIDDAERQQELFTTAADLSEEALGTISEKASEESRLGMWAVTLHLTAAYALKKCSQVERAKAHVQPVLREFERYGIPRSVVLKGYLRTVRLYRQLELEGVIKELLVSEMDQAFNTISDKNSAKQSLFEVKGNMNSVVDRAGSSLYAELVSNPRVLTNYIDDMAAVLVPNSSEHGRDELHDEARKLGDGLRRATIHFGFPLASLLGLYKQCYSKVFLSRLSDGSHS